MPLAALFPILLRTIGTTAAGWAISDWFNERKRAQQTNEQVSTKGLFTDNWLKWLVTGLVVAAVTAVFLFVFKEAKNRRK